MLLEYSIVMTSSNTISKGENGSGETLFRWLINLYTSIRSPLCLWQYKEYKVILLCMVNVIVLVHTNLVALRCICSSLSMFLAKYGFQIETQYSNCGQIYVLYSI